MCPFCVLPSACAFAVLSLLLCCRLHDVHQVHTCESGYPRQGPTAIVVRLRHERNSQVKLPTIPDIGFACIPLCAARQSASNVRDCNRTESATATI
jgi:hypothetical protein